MYQKDLKTPFPCDLSHQVRSLAQQVDQRLEPEAAIVNFYPLGTCMGGHLDDAEHTLDHPIVSLSLGCSAVFLLGGRTKATLPTPILVRSGDTVVMAGESRHCYHGVPVILSQEVEGHLMGTLPRTSSEAASPKVRDYLRSHRININVRQVRIDAESSDAVWVDKAGTGCVKFTS
jgi:alkylated DNA repair protein alkB family protein 1